MQRAGDYSSRLRHLACVRTRDTQTGQDVEAHQPNGYLWCSVIETGGRRQTDTGATLTGATAEIRVRNFPAVSALDLLQDEDAEYVWHIDSIRNGDNEIILDCYRNDNFNNVVIEEDSD